VIATDPPVVATEDRTVRVPSLLVSPRCPHTGGFSHEGAVPPIAGSAHRRDAIGAELAAEVTNVDIDHVRAGIEVETPDLAQQILAAQHLAGVPEELLGERELPR